MNTGTHHEYTLTIDGVAVAGEGEPLRIVNPATEELLALAPAASPAQLDQAVAAARRAFPGWRDTPAAERRAVVYRVAEVIEQHADELARILTSEQGKPFVQAQAEVGRAGIWARGLADIEFEDRVAVDDEQHRVVVRHTPLGVVGGIVPWNFPISLLLWKVAAALVTGNTMIAKPSPFTPLTTLRMGELLRDVVPAGVLNVLSGDDSLGPAMTDHPGIAKIAFTGSTATGKKVMAAASGTLKRITLELGGNDAAIVLPDVDVKDVAQKVFWAAFANSSQYCLATKRLYLHADIHDEFLGELVDYASTVVMGDGMDPATQIGPVQNRLQYEKVLGFIQESVDAGHDIVLRGDTPQGGGYFIGPTIVDNPPEDSRLAVEEPFGPILPVFTFTDDDDVIARANDSVYGLGGSVWGADLDRATRIAERIDSGVVWVNEIHVLSPYFPLTGHRESGVGPENGIEGLAEYCNTQSIAVAKPKRSAD